LRKSWKRRGPFETSGGVKGGGKRPPLGKKKKPGQRQNWFHTAKSLFAFGEKGALWGGKSWFRTVWAKKEFELEMGGPRRNKTKKEPPPWDGKGRGPPRPQIPTTGKMKGQPRPAPPRETAVSTPRLATPKPPNKKPNPPCGGGVNRPPPSQAPATQQNPKKTAWEKKQLIKKKLKKQQFLGRWFRWGRKKKQPKVKTESWPKRGTKRFFPNLKKIA